MCNPQDGFMYDKDEAMCIEFYFDLKDTLILDVFEEDPRWDCSKDAKLSMPTLEGMYDKLYGNLLCSATKKKYIQYCHVLADAGFQYKKDPNNPRDADRSFAYDAAKDKHFNEILQIFEAKDNPEAVESNVTDTQDNEITHTFLDFKKQHAFIEHFLSPLNASNLDPVMTALIPVQLEMLSKKFPFSEDLLILCYQFCVRTKNSELVQKFLDTIKDVAVECLGGGSKQSKESNEKKESEASEKIHNREMYKTRNYAFFKHYLLNSNIWLCKTLPAADGANGGNKKEVSLYEVLGEVIQQQIVRQRDYIWDQVKSEEKAHADGWNALTSVADFKNGNFKDLRQDCIENGVIPLQNEKDIRLTTAKMSDEEIFDVINESNTKQYLTQCLITAHGLNQQFQSKMQALLGAYGKYDPAPVKLYQRCVIKAQTDYRNKKFPSASNIVDYLRCSVTFEDPAELVAAVTDLTNKINGGEIDFLPALMRIKNGFNNAMKWKNRDDCNYVDLKLNCVFQDTKRLGRPGSAMVVEIQFLLKWLSKAKKLGHKLYGVLRREEFISRVSNNFYNVDQNEDNYTEKINSLIVTNEDNLLTLEMLYNPARLMKIMVQDGGLRQPVMMVMGLKKRYKMFLLFLSTIHFLNDVIIGDTENTLMKGYFNMPYTQYSFDHLIKSGYFWGIMEDQIVAGSTPYKCVETVLKSPHFDGIASDNAQDLKYGQTVFSSAVGRSPDYAQLIIKYFDKNRSIITQGYKHLHADARKQLSNIVTSWNTTAEFLSVLLDTSIKCDQMFSEHAVGKAIDTCNAKIKEYQSDSQQNLKDREQRIAKFTAFAELLNAYKDKLPKK